MLTLVIMTNVSTHKTTSSDYKLIYKELTKTIAKLNTKQASCFIDELFTEAEQVMVVKRFGAIFMFSQKYSSYRVATTLGISEPTAHRLYVNYKRRHYENLLKSFSSKEAYAFLQILNDLIAAQASPKARARLLNRAG